MDSCNGRALPGNFKKRAVLVNAEIARLESHDSDAMPLDAMPLHPQAIPPAGANGFVHNEASPAARF